MARGGGIWSRESRIVPKQNTRKMGDGTFEAGYGQVSPAFIYSAAEIDSLFLLHGPHTFRLT